MSAEKTRHARAELFSSHLNLSDYQVRKDLKCAIHSGLMVDRAPVA